MGGDIEFGSCDICKEENELVRTYYNYNIVCLCHSPNHFVFVRHCSTCVPKEPDTIRVRLKGINYINKK